jgi:hypothetical protein
MDVAVPFFDHLRKTPTMNRLFADYMRNVTSAEMWSLEHAVAGFDWGKNKRSLTNWLVLKLGRPRLTASWCSSS